MLFIHWHFVPAVAPFHQTVHVLRYLAVGNLRINLGAVDVGMAHHLRRAFYGNALGDQKGTEGVPCGVMGKVLLDAQHDTQPVNVVPKDVPLGQGEHGTGVVRGIVQFQNLPSGRVQGDEGLHLGLFPRLADIEPALRSFADVSGGQVSEEKMNMRRASSTLGSGIGVAIRRFSSLRLMWRILGGSFFS